VAEPSNDIWSQKLVRRYSIQTPIRLRRHRSPDAPSAAARQASIDSQLTVVAGAPEMVDRTVVLNR
jgi:hypothetical protein